MQLLLGGFIFRVIFTGIGFLISLLIAKLAGASQFGTLSLIIVNAAFIQIITGLGTDAAIVWHGLAGTNYSRNKIFSFTLITAAIQLFFFYIIAILGYFFLGHTLLGGSYDLRIFFAEIVYFTGLVLMDKFLSLYYSQHEARLCNKLLSVVSVILLVVALIIWATDPVLIVDYPVWIYSLFIFIPSFILAFFFIIKFNPAFKKISQEEMRSFSSFSFIVLITNIIQFIAFRADYWLISIYYDHVSVGVYAQASKFAQLLWIIPGVLAGLLVPALKNERHKLSDSKFISLCRVLFYVHIALMLLLIVAALVIYSLFLPSIYFDGFLSLLIMIPGYLIFTITTILAAYFSANRMLKINLAGSVLCCVLMILLDLILIPLLSYKGAAIANLITYSITTAYFIFRSIPVTTSSFKDFFTIKKSDFDLFSGEILITDNPDK
ncbi:MAG TPA: oligosaccharide flippase family protein [Chitinophagaceae bacterium]|nr:oligosaccharide flippase family protein [Chitinophagaceae bacterium]